MLRKNILPGEPLQLIVKKRSSFSILTCIFTILLLQLSTVVTPSGLPGRDVAQVVERDLEHAFETAQIRSQKEEEKTAMTLDQQRKESNVTFQLANNVSYFVFAPVFRSFVGETLVQSAMVALQAIKCLQTSISVKSC